ncbi:UNVERIFIED_ORG: type 1 fimbria pilin [Rahnella aquatilis]
MKNQMIKLSVIAAVLSGMTFSALAVTPTPAGTQLDLKAQISKGSCGVTPATTGSEIMDWGTLFAADFPAGPSQTAKGLVAEAKTITLKFENCNTDIAVGDTIKLVATPAGAVDATVAGADLWGDDATTGVGFLLSGKQGIGNDTPLTPDSNEMEILPTAGGVVLANAVAPEDLVLTVTPANYVANTAIQNGAVKSVVMLSTVYQ